MLQEIIAGCSFERGVLGFCRDRHLLPCTSQHCHRSRSEEMSLHPQSRGNEMQSVVQTACVCNPASKSRRTLTPTMAGMNAEDAVLSLVSQRPKDKCCRIPLTWITQNRRLHGQGVD